MQNPQDVQRHVDALRELCPQAAPRMALVLGTGLGTLADAMEDAVRIPYASLPGFPRSTTDSHAGCFLLGSLSGVPVICQQGRCHLYEGYSPRDVCAGVRVMRGLGATGLIITNAAGALNPRFDAGDLMLVTDHINATGRSPLTGRNCEAWGPRFPDMSAPYDADFQRLALRKAAELGIRLERGVYLCTPGPQLETPAETRFYRAAGADAVGMSTVLEVIAARHMGMRVLGLSCLTNKNLPDCMAEATLEDIIASANSAADALGRLIRAVLPDM